MGRGRMPRGRVGSRGTNQQPPDYDYYIKKPPQLAVKTHNTRHSDMKSQYKTYYSDEILPFSNMIVKFRVNHA